jgi:ubiquinone/menaquinone biosynthesis C-methylase UbiE
MTKTTDEEIKAWYNQKHFSLGENAWRPYEAYPVFLDYLNVKTGRKLLDVGCGTGHLLKAAEQRGLETYGIDISDEAVKVAKRVSPNSEIMLGKGEDLTFSDNYFDYVTYIGSLEHFLNVNKGIKEMIRVAKNDAFFCIVVPNTNFLFWKFKSTKGTDQQDINETLLSLKQWKNIFNNEGLEIFKVYQDKWFMKKTKIFLSANILGIVKRSIYKLIWFFLPLNYAYQFIFILRKKITV